MTKAYWNCKYEINPIDENGELTELCLSCGHYLNFVPWNE
jgi:hypothetical protein